MPFQEEFFEVYGTLKQEFSEGFEFNHAGDLGNAQNILKDIIQGIQSADLIIADLTGLNANVFYELGIAHALNKKVVMLTKNGDDIPFDLKSYKYFTYSTHYTHFPKLLEQLRSLLNGVKDDSVAFSNPVNDFLAHTTLAIEPSIVDKATTKETLDVINDDGESGVWDNLTEIEQDMDTFTSAITSLTNDMNTMSTGLESVTNEIEKKGQAGASGNASFMHKKASQGTNYIQEYSKSLKRHNGIFAETWYRVERNLIDLLKNNYASISENQKEIVSNVNGLTELRSSMLSNKEITVEYLKTVQSLRGMERSLNQAVNALEFEVNALIEFFSQMDASILRILDKANFLLNKNE